MSRSIHVPPGLFDSRPYGFAQVAIVPTPFGKVVHVSGQVAWDADQNIVGLGDNPPCSTWIGVPNLADDEFLIEVEPSIVLIERR